MQPDSEPEISAFPGVPVMIVNDVIWSGGKDVCGYVYFCVSKMWPVCVPLHIFKGEDTSSDWVGGHFMLAGREVQQET